MPDKTTIGYRIDATPTGDIDLLPPMEGPGGSLFVEGVVARPGIYEYRRSDGSTRRELVRREDLWNMDSIETLGRAPLTVEHPPEMITPDNYRTYAHGDSSEEIIEAKKGFVKVRLALRSREALDAAKSGKTQLSPGYRVETLEEPGEDPEFGQYDAIQVRRTYNHIAMTDEARGGDAMAYRVDSKHGEVLVGGLRDDDKSTPAKPSERVKGSKKNPSGSASGKRGGIEISETVEKGLRSKVDEHNEKHGDTPSKKVDLGMLKAVYRRGAGAFSTSHRPGMTRNQWSMGRVNAFLRLVRTGKPKDAQYTNDNDLLPDGHARADAEQMYAVPEAAQNNAKKALRWLEEKEGARGMTPAGMRTARKLASGDKIPLSLVAKMAGFARHRKNSEVDPQYKDEPWRDAGYVAWLGWGGTTGVDFARKITGADEGDSMKKTDSYEEEEMQLDEEVVEEEKTDEEVVSEEKTDEEVVSEEKADEDVVEEEKNDEEVVEEEKADEHTEEHKEEMKADEEVVEEEKVDEEEEEEEKNDEEAPLTADQLKVELASFKESMQELLKPLLALIPQEEEMPGRADTRVDSLLSDPQRYHMLRSRFDAMAQDLQVCYGDEVSLSDLARTLVEKARPELKFDSDADYIAAAQMVNPASATITRESADSAPPSISVRSPYGPKKN